MYNKNNSLNNKPLLHKVLTKNLSFYNFLNIKKPKFINLKTLNQPLSILISLSLIFPNFMLANIIADINAPKHNQPTILKTPNSAIQIDITKPTSKGVSINEYSKFNTSKDGTILNNSRINTNTKIGGLITANPRLSESSAKLIVNKVNSNEKSSLTGNIEIAGDKADLIIANPSGINIDGTHFINSKSTTLTTGNIEYENGGIKNIAVNKGEILITSRGLKDESNYLNILTHSAKINANIHANEINIITGDNTINKDGSILSNNENSIKTSKFSIDSSSLGGMYANKIKLIATKNGIGVNNAGVILANQINISSNGDLINSNTIISNDTLDVNVKNIKNFGNGVKLANISANSFKLKADNLDNTNAIIQTNTALDIKARNLKNTLSIIGKDISSNSNLNNKDLSTTSNNHSLIVVDNTISNDNSKILSNELNLDIKDTITNENSKLNIKDIGTSTDEISNTNSDIIVDNSINLKTKNLTQNSSNIHSNKDINLEIYGTLLNANKSSIVSSNEIFLKSINLNNIGSNIISGGDFSINTNNLNNKDSLIASGKKLNINTNTYKNHATLEAKSDLSLNVKDDNVVYNGGFYAKNNISINTAKNFINNTKLISNNALSISANNIINNSILYANDNLDLFAAAGLNNFNKIASNANLSLNANEIINKSSGIYATKDISFNANTINNISNSDIYSNGNININADLVLNKNSSNIIAVSNLKIKNDKTKDYKSSLIDNSSSLIYAGKDIGIIAKDVKNYSQDELKTYITNSNSNTINLRGYKVAIKQDIGKLKDDIIQTYKINNNYKNPSNEYVDTTLKEKIINSTQDLYVINLYKDTKAHGKNIYDSITIDYDNKVAYINTSHIKDHEKTRNIIYNIAKQNINADDLAKFRSSQIVSGSDINFIVNDLLNDKSIVYANNDINLYKTNLTNKGLELTNTISSNANYVWKEKVKRGLLRRSKWKDRGGSVGSISTNYTEVGYPAIFAAGGKITGQLSKLSNGSYNDTILATNNPNFKDAYSNTFLNYLSRFDTSAKILNKNSNQTIITHPKFQSNTIALGDRKYYYLNNSAIYTSDLPNNDYMHNKLSSFYDFRNSIFRSIMQKDIIVPNFASIIHTDEDIILDIDGNLENYGFIASKSNISIKADNITNHQASMTSGGAFNLKANNNIENLSSLIKGDSVSLIAGNDIYNTTLSSTKTIKQGNYTYTDIGKKSDISSTNKDIYLNANNNIFINGAGINSSKSIAMISNADISVNTVQNKGSYDFKTNGGYYKRDYTLHNGSNINAKDFIYLKSNNNITLDSANIYADKNLVIDAKNNINVISSLDNDYSESKITSKGFLSKKTTYNQTLSQNVNSSNLNAKNISLISGENTTIIGSNLHSTNTINIDANNINLAGADYQTFNFSQITKSGLGGLKRSLDMHSLAKSNIQGSNLSTDNKDINLFAKNDLNIISSDISSGANINLNAGNNLNILAAKEHIKEQSIHKKSSFNPLGLLTFTATLGTSGGEIYTAKLNEQGSLDGLSKLSNITANDSINLNANDMLVTANLSSKNNINIKSNSASILNATNTHESYSINKKTSISIAHIQDILKDTKPKSLSELKKDTSTKIRLANATYEKATKNTTSTNSIASNINAKNLNIDTKKDITIIGSNLSTTEDIKLTSKDGNIYISNATNTIDTTTTLKQAKAALSLSVQNEYAQIAPAAIELEEAVKQLKSVKKEYDEYKQAKFNLEAKLLELKQRYNNKEAGIDQSDIEDLIDVIDNVKDEEKYYITNIALATTNVASKTTALTSQIAAASSSGYTYGFSIGIVGDVSGHQSRLDTKQTTSISSNLKASNITLSTNKNTSTNITGSNLIASNDINIDTKDLNINASTNTYTSNENTKDLSGSVKFTMYGGGGGSAVLNYTQGYFNIDNLIHNNSLLYAKNNLNINTSNDTTIQGANLRADNIANIKVGNNLSLISQRDSYSSTHKSTNIGAGIGISGEKSQSNNPNPYAISNNMINYDNSKLSNINSNFSQSNSNTITKQTNLSSITANELNINTKNNTHLKGSLIAAGYYKDNTKNSNNNLVFIDNKNLNLTTNTLTYENLSNTSYTKDSSLSVGLNYAIKESIVAKENKANDTKQINQIDNQANTTTKQTNQDINSKISSLNYSNNRNLSYNHSKTLATIGQGNLIVANTNISNLNKDELENLQSTNTNLSNSDNLTRLNRDTTKTNKDLYNTNISSNVDATLDTRLLTENGREEIKRDYEDSLTIVDAITQIVTTNRAKSSDFFKENIKAYNTLQGVREFIDSNEAIREYLSSNDTNIQDKEIFTKIITNSVMSNLGYIPANTKLIYTDEKGYDNKDIQGYYSLQTDTSYINLKNIFSTKDIIKVIAHETSRAIDAKSNINITTNRDDNTKYASNFANYTTRYFSDSLNKYNKEFIAISPISNSIYKDNPYIISNNSEFITLDKDMGDNLSIFIHGTWSSPKDADPEFIEALSTTFKEPIYQFEWSGENNKKARASGAIKLTEFVENYKFKEGEPLNLVMHSHGGNVGKDFTQFYEGDKKIDNFIMLGTPVRDDYFINYDNFTENANILNVYDSSDVVQVFGGIYNYKSYLLNKYSFGYISKITNGAKNIKIETPNNHWYDGLIGDHTNMDSKPVWEQIKNEIR
ncbi:filamentous hemeagglutinin family protein [Campylobacter sputorum bv. faecalis CCUG 20703]|nr:filamentous hemeagglutinin family protein [Campylobacter sputorum bv. faecalis CCUG 20703]